MEDAQAVQQHLLHNISRVMMNVNADWVQQENGGYILPTM